MKTPTTHPDIESVIKQVKSALPFVVVDQWEVTHDADDDGIWWFSIPGVKPKVHVENSYGKCPFIIETNEQSSYDALQASSVEQTVKYIVDYLTAASEGRSIRM